MTEEEKTIQEVAKDYGTARKELDDLNNECNLSTGEKVNEIQKQINALQAEIAVATKPWKEKMAAKSAEIEGLELSLLERWDPNVFGKTIKIPEIGEVQLRETEKMTTPDWQTQHIDAEALLKNLLEKGLNKSIKNVTYDTKALKGLMAAGMLLPGVSTQTSKSIVFKE